MDIKKKVTRSVDHKWTKEAYLSLYKQLPQKFFDFYNCHSDLGRFNLKALSRKKFFNNAYHGYLKKCYKVSRS